MNTRYDLLDGLRGLAAILVVLHHSLSPWGLGDSFVPHAPLAVDFFFALSGFVLAFAYEEKLRLGLSIRSFMAKRLIRLYPSILLGIALGLLILLTRFKLQNTPTEIPAMLVSVVKNIFMIPSGDFLGNHNEAWPANPPQWSLMFELLASLMFAAFLWRQSTWKIAIWTTIAAAATIYFGLSMNGVNGGEGWSNWHLGFVRIAYPFLAGVLYHRMIANTHPSIATSNVAVFIVCSALILMLAIRVPEAWNGAYEVAIVLIGNMLIIFFASRLQPSHSVAALIRWLGNISYPLYAIHYPIVRAASGYARRFEGNLTTEWLIGIAIATLGVSLIAAHIVLYLYDIPIRKYLTTKLIHSAQSANLSPGPVLAETQHPH